MQHSARGRSTRGECRRFASLPFQASAGAMNTLFPVMLGGALGAGCRHLLGQIMLARLGPGFPLWTFTANIAGSLAIGLLVGWLARRGGRATTPLFPRAFGRASGWDRVLQTRYN